MSSAAVPTLPADLAALLDATGELRLLHPATGRPIHLVPTEAADESRPALEEPPGLKERQADLAAIREGLEDARAGRFVSDAEIAATMEAEFSILRDRGAEAR